MRGHRARRRAARRRATKGSDIAISYHRGALRTEACATAPRASHMLSAVIAEEYSYGIHVKHAHVLEMYGLVAVMC